MLRTALFCSVLFCLLTRAYAAPPDWRGVWSGTLGSTRIVACNNGNGSANYYDTTRPRLHSMQLLDGLWLENAGGARWEVESVERNQLLASRIDADSGSVMPLQLTRRSMDGGQAPCSSLAYLGDTPLTPQLTASTEQRFEDRRHSALAMRLLDDPALVAETIQLPATTPVIEQLNQQWRDALPQTESLWAPWRDCATRSLGIRAESGMYQERSSISFWTRPWLALQTSLKTRCADDPETNSWGYRLWDLVRGKQVDPWSWFGLREAFPDHKYQRGWAKLTPALQRLVLRDWPEDDECRGGETWFALRPGLLGMVFEQVGTPGPCNEEVEIPWTRLQPVLNAAGKLAVRSLANSVQQEGN